MALMHSNQTPVGKPAPDFALPATDGRMVSLNSYADSKVIVVIFTCNHCPYAIAVEDRIIELQNDYASKGVQIIAINPNDSVSYPDDSFEKMKERATAHGFNFPYLQDETQSIAKAYDAACTPDFFVLNHERIVVYNGRLDDNWQEPKNVSRNELRDVLDATLAEHSDWGFEPTASMGCSIKWK